MYKVLAGDRASVVTLLRVSNALRMLDIKKFSIIDGKVTVDVVKVGTELKCVAKSRNIQATTTVDGDWVCWVTISVDISGQLTVSTIDCAPKYRGLNLVSLQGKRLQENAEEHGCR